MVVLVFRSHTTMWCHYDLSKFLIFLLFPYGNLVGVAVSLAPCRRRYLCLLQLCAIRCQ